VTLQSAQQSAYTNYYSDPLNACNLTEGVLRVGTHTGGDGGRKTVCVGMWRTGQAWVSVRRWYAFGSGRVLVRLLVRNGARAPPRALFDAQYPWYAISPIHSYNS